MSTKGMRITPLRSPEDLAPARQIFRLEVPQHLDGFTVHQLTKKGAIYRKGTCTTDQQEGGDRLGDREESSPEHSRTEWRTVMSALGDVAPDSTPSCP